MSDSFSFDVFLSYSRADEDTVKALAERLRADGIRVWFDEWNIKPGESIPARIEEGLEKSRMLILCMSAHAFGSDWSRLESYTFRFRDAMNKEGRFLPLRLDDAPIKGSLAQFLYIDWRPDKRDESYPKLLEACRAVEPEPGEVLEEGVVQPKVKVHSLGHTEVIIALAFGPKDNRFLSGSDDETMRLWDFESGKCLQVMEGDGTPVRYVAWRRDGRLAVSGNWDGKLGLWDMESGACLRWMETDSQVRSIAWRGSSDEIIVGTLQGDLQVWDVRRGQRLRTVEGHRGPIQDIAVNGDGSQAVTPSFNTLMLWDLETGACRKIASGHADYINCVAWSGDGRFVLSGGADSTIGLWSVEKEEPQAVWKGHTGPVSSIAASIGTPRVLSGSADKTMRLWDLESGDCLLVMKGELDEPAMNVALSHDGRWGLSTESENLVRRWDLDSGERLGSFRVHTDSVFSVAWSVDATRVLSGSRDKTARLWDIESGTCLRVLEGHHGSIYGVAMSADRSRALTASEDNTVRVWYLETGECLRELAGTKGIVNCVAWNTDGNHAASGGADGLVRIWNVQSGDCVQLLEGHDKAIQAVAWSPDDIRVASGGNDNVLRVWESASGFDLWALEGHLESILGVAWNGEGNRILSASNDNTVRVWDLEKGTCQRVLEGHVDSVWSVAWSADDALILSSGDDGTVRIWDAATGTCLRVLEGHTSEVYNVAWSADGRTVHSAASNGVWREWDVSDLVAERSLDAPASSPAVPEQVQYTNARVLLVGDSGVGKTGLSNYLAQGISVNDGNPLPSTDGAWATQWLLPHESAETNVAREIWLWDFAGQVDYRLVHQLFMDDTAVAVLVFNPQSENPYESLGQWERDLRKASRKPFAKLLAAGRVDRGGLVVSDSTMRDFMAERNIQAPLHLTSAMTGEGCDDLRDAIIAAIDWSSIPETTTPSMFRKMKNEIIALRDGGFVLITLAELKQRFEMTLKEEKFALDELKSVLRLLSSPGMIRNLEFGEYVLLQPELLSRYAAALIRQVRKHPRELGCITEEELTQGRLDYQDFERLSPEQEQVILRALLEILVERAWCFRQVSDHATLLTFPSYFRRERPEQPARPDVLMTYRFDGPADEIYATLVVRLHHTVAFESDEFWRRAADFKTQTGALLGIMLSRENEGRYRLEVYFDPDVDENSRVLFLRYINDHLLQHAENVKRLRHYCCVNNDCDMHGKRFLDQEALDRALRPEAKGRVFCSDCGSPINLRDVIEEKFESEDAKREARELGAGAQRIIDRESLKLILVGHAASMAAEAGQLYRGGHHDEFVIHGEIELIDDEGKPAGKSIYLKLWFAGAVAKASLRGGNRDTLDFRELQSMLATSPTGSPVFLVHRAFDGGIQWMDVTDFPKRGEEGPIWHRRFEYNGERFDALSIRRLRKKLLEGN